MLIAKYNDEHKKDHRKCTTMKKLTQEQRQLIAFRYSATSNKSAELKKFNLNIALVLDAIKNDNRRFQPSTLQRLIRFANNDPLAEKPKAKATKQKSVKTQVAAEATSRGAITPPNTQNQGLSTAIQVAQNPTIPNENDFFILEQLKSLKTLYELNQDLTKQLMMRVDNATRHMDESAKAGLDNFERQSKAFDKRLSSLEEQFATFLKRHEYQNKEITDIKERVHKIEIKEWPTKFNK